MSYPASAQRILSAPLIDCFAINFRSMGYDFYVDGGLEPLEDYQTMKNRVLLENYYLPSDLERQIGAFVAHYNNPRYHESLNNVTPSDVYFRRDKVILREREKIKTKRHTQSHKRTRASCAQADPMSNFI